MATKKSAREQQIDQLNAKLDAINAKLKETTVAATNKGYDAKDALDAKVSAAKEEVGSLKQRYNSAKDQLRDKLSTDLAQAQMNHELFKQSLHDKKEANDARKLSQYIDDMLAYSEDCADLSLLFAAESKLAVLEALLAITEYEEKYGDEAE